MVATITASYFLLTADYGPEPNVLDPVSRHSSFFSFESSVSVCAMDAIVRNE